MARLSDEQLIQMLQKAARRLNRRLNLEDTPDEISVDASGEILPNSPRLQDLVLLQAECLIASRDFMIDLNSGGAGVLAKDGEQTFDNREGVKARSSHFNSKYGPCAELEEAIKFELLNRGGGGEIGNVGFDVW